MPEAVERRDHWKYPAVPEARIDKEAVKAVSEKLGITEEWVRRAHDFQWKMIYDACEAGNSIYVACMFRTQRLPNPFLNQVRELHKRKVKLQGMIEKTEQKIINCSHSRWRGVKYTRRKAFEEKLEELQKEFSEVDKKIDDLILLLNTKTTPKARGKFKKPK